MLFFNTVQSSYASNLTADALLSFVVVRTNVIALRREVQPGEYAQITLRSPASCALPAVSTILGQHP